MMITQESQGYGARSRSRSRTRSRSVKRTRSVRSMGTMTIPPSVRYAGACQLTRSCVMSVPIVATHGFQIQSVDWTEAFISFSPQYLKLHGDDTHFIQAAVPFYAELAGVWERVRIDKVELSITSNLIDEAATVASGQAPSSNAPRLILANDYMGPKVGASVNTSLVNQQTGAKFYHAGGDHPIIKWTCNKPKYNRLVQYSDIESASEPATGFIASDTDIPHCGVRIGIANAEFVHGCRLSIFAKFFFSFKNIH